MLSQDAKLVNARLYFRLIQLIFMKITFDKRIENKFLRGKDTGYVYINYFIGRE
jgi:hypothetical protein